MSSNPLRSAEFPATSKNITSRHVHDTPEAKKSGQIWYHQEKSKHIKYSYLLNGNEMGATISIYQDLSLKYQLDLCFVACLSLSKEEADRETEIHKSRFIGFKTECNEENGLFSVLLIKTQPIELYTDFHEIADSLVKQYGLAYLEPKMTLSKSHQFSAPSAEALATEALVDENTVSQGQTTHSETTIIADSHTNKKRKEPSTEHTPSTQQTKARKKTITQVKGQSSILNYLKKI